MNVRVRRPLRIRGGSLLVLALLVGILTGCAAPTQIAVRLVNGDLTFSVCQRAFANRIEVSTFSDSANNDEPTLIWGATGPTGTHDSVTFSSDHLPGESILDAPPRELILAAHELYLRYDVDVNGVAEDGLFASWDGDDVSSEYWLDSDGDQHVEWCNEQ